jgi:hypothetical protein
MNLEIELKANKKPSPIKISPMKVRIKICGKDSPKNQVASMHRERINK